MESYSSKIMQGHPRSWPEFDGDVILTIQKCLMKDDITTALMSMPLVCKSWAGNCMSSKSVSPNDLPTIVDESSYDLGLLETFFKVMQTSYCPTLFVDNN